MPPYALEDCPRMVISLPAKRPGSRLMSAIEGRAVQPAKHSARSTVAVSRKRALGVSISFSLNTEDNEESDQDSRLRGIPIAANITASVYRPPHWHQSLPLFDCARPKYRGK